MRTRTLICLLVGHGRSGQPYGSRPISFSPTIDMPQVQAPGIHRIKHTCRDDGNGKTWKNLSRNGNEWTKNPLFCLLLLFWGCELFLVLQLFYFVWDIFFTPNTTFVVCTTFRALLHVHIVNIQVCTIGIGTNRRSEIPEIAQPFHPLNLHKLLNNLNQFRFYLE